MSFDLSVGSPLNLALQNVIKPKLAEYGWVDDDELVNYIILNVANGKTPQQISSELANDFLDLGNDNPQTQEFAQWLFQQVHGLQQQLNGGQQSGSDDAAASNSMDDGAPASFNDIQHVGQDSEMGEAPTAVPAAGAIPTGPKAMRSLNGNSSGNGMNGPRDKRMLNQVNRHLDRSNDSSLHRIRGTSGTGRINSHSSREPPRGPRNQQQIGRGMAAMANGRGMGGVAVGGMGGMNGMNNMGGMPPMPMPGMPPMDPNQMGALNPQQQMLLFQMYEQQAQMMQQLFAGQTPTPHVNPNFPGGNRNGQGKSLFDRIDKSRSFRGGHGHKQPLPQSRKFPREGQDSTMLDDASTAEQGESSTAMEMETTRPEPGQTVCKFNLSCTKPDCPFAHQSPAAPPGTTIDMNDVCSFGAACVNKKCAGKHPSPAQREQHKTEVDCMFYPNCRDMANCPFRHPSMPPCRNGADCTVPGCKFAHSKVMCRYNPCTNRYCTYKHAEGQKALYPDKVWTAPKNDSESKEHVSERKFVDENAEEELILPGRSSPEETEILT
ncbi:hypothetical protein GQ43DRAFT_457122 [Delitschia confertaspora ATCC 74209]|uniref:Nab2-like CCCH zinc finger domain-containing protein n=1 Tax=Delitschia confertaspora ATCC 74209 TaxID=1513339 RepID=A0A9P4MTX4_9PLEO|nr:hypothetical protein GQ43DRAFT_457122 [Delitschia confertaspora ATCC 74209]